MENLLSLNYYDEARKCWTAFLFIIRWLQRHKMSLFVDYWSREMQYFLSTPLKTLLASNRPTFSMLFVSACFLEGRRLWFLMTSRGRVLMSCKSGYIFSNTVQLVIVFLIAHSPRSVVKKTGKNPKQKIFYNSFELWQKKIVPAALVSPSVHLSAAQLSLGGNYLNSTQTFIRFNLIISVVGNISRSNSKQ